MPGRWAVRLPARTRAQRAGPDASLPAVRLQLLTARPGRRPGRPGRLPLLPLQPGLKEQPTMTTVSGETTTTASTRAFVDAMLAHNTDVRAEIERAAAGLARAGVSGPVLDGLHELAQHY